MRPLPDDHLDPATYQRTATGTRAVVVPLTIRVAPVTSLALQNSDLEATLERDERGNIHIVFAVTDTSGRRIEGAFHENSPLPSLPTQLLAPVGASARTPVMFPHFVLHDFDFVRLGGRMEVTVDGHPLQLGGIPVPLVAQGQPRSFVKFVPETEVTHLFAGDALERIRVRTTEVAFDPPLDLRARGEGDWSIRTEGHGGGVQGR